MDRQKTRTFGAVPGILKIDTEEYFTNVRDKLHHGILQTMLKHPYDTLDTLANLHSHYRKPGLNRTLEELASSLPVSYDAQGLSCVGLSLKFMEYFSKSSPNITPYLFLITGDEYSYEVSVPQHQKPPIPEAVLVKGHVLVALEFLFKGRRGYFLIDVGLALDIPVVVMRDGLSPHTGTFTQLSRLGFREYAFEMTDQQSDYVIWAIKEVKGDKDVLRRRFLYVGQAFLFPDELERRNWFYHYHGKVFLGPGGVKAGLYFVLGQEPPKFTVFVSQEPHGMRSASFTYDYFVKGIPEDFSSVCSRDDQHVLEMFSKECGYSGIPEFANSLLPVSKACCDEQFVGEILNINQKFNAILHKDMT